ncbi:MAG TPA: DoxX family membrane protein [Candidatus Sulfotelmatobacter sp.]|nr:DoxX family membrane protein [Candidatus Sulfotelmatobacter sp.]
MLPATNFWMCFAGLVYLMAGLLVLRKDISMARGWDKLVSLGPLFIAVSLATFAPEHFHGGPDYIQSMAPSYMPVHWVWPYFIGCALLAAAISLALRKFERLACTFLALMFTSFVCLIYLPGVFAHPRSRFAWIFALRDLSFAAGAWALAGIHHRDSWPRGSKWMIHFGRVAIAVAAIFYGAQHFLHPQFAPGVPLEKITPSWVPFPSGWAYLAGLVLLAAGISLAVNRQARMVAASIGGLMTVLTVFLYLPILILAYRGSTPQFNEEINYVADTLLYAGAALALAAALPRAPDRVKNAEAVSAEQGARERSPVH